MAHAFAYRAVRHGNYPMVGTMRVHVLRELALVLGRWDDASIHPVLGRLERDIYADGKVAYGEALNPKPRS